MKLDKTLRKGDLGEEIVINKIKELNDDYFLINNLILIGENNMSHQFDHILIRHNGVFVIETKNYYGQISGTINDTIWSKSLYKKGKLVNEKFMNPIKQNKAHIRALKKIIGKDIPFINFVVFVNNDVTHLGIYNVCNLDQLINRIKLWEIDTPLSYKEMEEINHQLLLLEADIQVEDHVSNIKDLKKIRRDIKMETKFVIEKGLCPICGNKVQISKNIYSCPVCQYKLTR